MVVAEELQLVAYLRAVLVRCPAVDEETKDAACRGAST